MELTKHKLNKGSDRKMNNPYICYHFSPGFVSLSVVGPLLFLLQHALSCRTVLKGKLTQDLAEAMYADLSHRIDRMPQEQQKGVKPANVQEWQKHLSWENLFGLKTIN